MFLGTFYLTLDPRGRIPIKKGIRHGTAKFSIVKSDDGCLHLRPGHAGEEGERIDNYDRLLIPLALRREVGLIKEVVLVGCGEYFELWGRGKWKSTLLQLSRELKKVRERALLNAGR